jgi:hypothetical protein
MIDKEMFLETIRQKMEYAEFVTPKVVEANGDTLKRGDARIVTAFSEDNEMLFEIRYVFGGEEPANFVLKLATDRVNEEGKRIYQIYDFSKPHTGEIEPIEAQLERLSVIEKYYRDIDVRLKWLGDK